VTKKKHQEAHERAAKQSRERDADIAMAEYRREQEAISKRTAELRALRLAYEAKHGPRKKVRAARIAQSVTKGTLSDWYEEQKQYGRKT
jgi:hypothetical protein